ncbi:MAG: 16S rRNA (cytosine(967)-C(5))-methyltransferase RsmB [Lachnospiraceae bacterium]|nr:16S rRNA (cytosine(967)-C(5))-methyltransferase RsmB [Lachnospiraceae bacterium]
MTDNTREIVLSILNEISEGGIYSHMAIRGALDRFGYLPKRDRAFITRVCEGTVERMIELDYIINRYSTIPAEKMKPVIRDILRSAVYQIRYMDNVPDAAAVNEAVKLTQQKGFYNLKGFVNGVLRSVIRGGDQVEYPDKETDPVGYYSVKYSMPEWLVRQFMEEYGPIVTQTILAALITERPMTVRFKTDRISQATILDSLKSQGVRARRAPYLPYAYELTDYNYLPSLAAFRNGWIFPQDVSSMLVAEVAAPKKGDYVIDMCAAPGGKSLHIADKMGHFGEVEARDLTDDKVALIRENVRRAGIINVRPMQMDALVYDHASEEKADIVICDVPCSGLGVIARKSDIKYRITPEKIDSLVELQRMILRNAAAYVRPGGRLIYSTCTLSRKENEENVQWFTQHFPFETESLNPYLPRTLWRFSTEKGYIQLVPGIHETDGFFIARMKKRII